MKIGQILQRVNQCRPRTKKERQERMQKIKPVILLFCVLFSFIVALGSSYAWFTSVDNIENELYSREDKRHFSVIAVDDFPEPNKPRTPGNSIAKRVGAHNNGSRDAFVRIMVIPTITAADGTALPAAFGTQITADFNKTDWIDGEDGYFYYKYILPKGISTDTMPTPRNLFESVEIAEGLDKRYTGAELNIEVKVEACGINPADEYVNSWWHGKIPANTTVLFTVHTTLQAALAV